jgi:isopropylmalate/homocitrate/citramalate synthase
MQLNDVTLREGDQMPGREFTADEKIRAARRLDDLGLSYIQPAFPITGEKDQSVVAELAGTTDADIIALARAVTRDIDVSLEAGADVVEVFVSVSDRHLEHLLGKSRAEMLEMLTEAVDYVVDHGGTPHVTLADAFRTDHADLIEVFESLPDVPMLTLADSVGVRTPASVRAFLGELSETVNLDRVGVHFHDDLGCGTANVLAAYQLGVAKADVSVAGLGERAGNSSLEEVVAASTVDSDDDLGVDVGKLIPVCRDVLDDLGESYGERKAVLGTAIAEHESGIHTAAMLSDPATLEPFDPAVFGGSRRLVFGKPTGKSGVRKLLQRAGIDADEATVDAFSETLSEHGPLELADAVALAEREYGD